MVVLALDTIEFPVAFWGAIRGGIIPIPLNTLLSTEQYAYMIEDSRAPLLLVSEALAKTVEPALPKMSWLKAVIVIGDKKIISTGSIPAYSFDDVVAKPIDRAELDYDEYDGTPTISNVRTTGN